MTAVEEASAPTGLQGVPQARRSACCGGMRVLTHRPTSLDGVPASGAVVCVDEVEAVAYEFTDPSAARAWLDGAVLEPVAVRPADEDERVAALGCVELGTW